MNSLHSRWSDNQTVLIRALCAPDSTVRLNESEWDLLIRQGRRANLLARLAARIEEGHLQDQILPAALNHLISAERAARRQDAAMRLEVNYMQAALTSLRAPIILLKGAAYLMAGLPPARGRQFSDVDILVPKDLIGDVESHLMIHGWQGTGHNAYDQRYYRNWMHEIPPLRHVQRGAIIDVHHSILPETARIKVNTAALWDAPVALPGYDSLFVLNPIDMVIHSATHLFHEGELHNGLRDLSDLDSLLRHFGGTAGFWDEIIPRAKHLGLTRPLYYAFRYSNRMLGTPIPQSVIDRTPGPAMPVRGIQDFCFLRALLPDHASCADAGMPIARFALYVRSHWLRMPLHLLAYHLTRKVLTSKEHETEKSEAHGKAPRGNQPAA